MKSNQHMVIAPPRSGFTLLLSVLSILNRDRGKQKQCAQQIANPFIAVAGEYIDAAIRDFFHTEVGEDNLFYNKEFSILVGGPKWISPTDTDSVCVRKYLGIKGQGDFTFILHLPRWVMEFDDIIHSHSHPSKWLGMTDYSDFRKFASIRNPIDIIHSSVFSINALASEYIQRELDINEHEIRRELALNKLTNLETISGLNIFLKKYIDEFIPIAKQYDYLMRWEDLIQEPIAEIQRIAVATGEPVSAEYASKVWSELDHKNLTRYHRHSFRRGLLNDWQFNLTNTHMKLFEEAGFDSYLEFFGYPPIKHFDENTYNSDQQLIEEHLLRGQPYTENLDQDLITFAFNKTNFTPPSDYKFRHYPRRGAIEIEKSTLIDENLSEGFMVKMAPITEMVYHYLQELQVAANESAIGNDKLLKELQTRYNDIFFDLLGNKVKQMFDDINIDRADISATLPTLVGSVDGYNIVSYGMHHYSVPQSLGPMDLSELAIPDLPKSILVTSSYNEALKEIAGINK